MGKREGMERALRELKKLKGENFLKYAKVEGELKAIREMSTDFNTRQLAGIWEVILTESKRSITDDFSDNGFSSNLIHRADT